MTSKEFVIWMKGIVTASNNYNVTPATWDDIKQQLETVTNDVPLSNTSHQVFNNYVPIGSPNVSSTLNKK